MIRSCTIGVPFMSLFMSPKNVKVLIITGLIVRYQLSNILTNYFSSFETLPLSQYQAASCRIITVVTTAGLRKKGGKGRKEKAGRG